MSHHNNNDDTESVDDDVEYGIRLSRRRTSYHHRNSSALYTAQRMEQEVYYDSAKAFSEIALSYTEIIGSLFILYTRYTASLTTAAVNTIDAIKTKADKLKG